MNSISPSIRRASNEVIPVKNYLAAGETVVEQFGLHQSLTTLAATLIAFESRMFPCAGMTGPTFPFHDGPAKTDATKALTATFQIGWTPPSKAPTTINISNGYWQWDNSGPQHSFINFDWAPERVHRLNTYYEKVRGFTLEQMDLDLWHESTGGNTSYLLGPLSAIAAGMLDKRAWKATNPKQIKMLLCPQAATTNTEKVYSSNGYGSTTEPKKRQAVIGTHSPDYLVTSYTEIDNTDFRQLHPLISLVQSFDTPAFIK